jgi:apolipoprotein N-acyltransferase
VPAVALLALVCTGCTARQGALLGLLHGTALFLLPGGVDRRAGRLGALVALSLLEASFLALLGAALAVVTRSPGWPLWSAALWVGQEALRSRLPFGGFPWGRLAFSQGDSLLTPLAALGGAPVVTFAVALLAGALAWSARRLRTSPPAAAAVLAGALVAVLGGAALVPVPTSGDPVRVAVVQGNVPRLGLDFNAQRAAVLGNHVQATRDLAADVRAGREQQPDLVVWPENASDIDPFTDPAAYDAIDGAVRTSVSGPGRRGAAGTRGEGQQRRDRLGPGDRPGGAVRQAATRCPSGSTSRSARSPAASPSGSTWCRATSPPGTASASWTSVRCDWVT